MAKNVIREELNRGHQIKSEKNDVKQSVTLFDIDYAMMSYLEDVALPTITEGDGNVVKIPVIYGNSERWNGARREGVYRDIKGKIQLPLMMLRRTSIAKDESMPMLNRHLSYSTVTKWNRNNRYDRFTILGNTKPSYELYNITMPDYVEVNYECMAWTSFTEHLNKVIEHLTFSSEYWGDKKKFKFRTTIADYNVINEVGEGTERINRVEFTLNVKAYLLPEKYDGESTTKKSFSTKVILDSLPIIKGQDPQEDGTFVTTLPRSGVTIKLKPLTYGELNEITKMVDSYPMGRVAPRVTWRLQRQIVEIDGSSDKGDIAKFVDQMPIADSKYIRTFMNENEPRLNMFKEVIAPSGDRLTVNVGFGVEFFRPFF